MVRKVVGESEISPKELAARMKEVGIAGKRLKRVTRLAGAVLVRTKFGQGHWVIKHRGPRPPGKYVPPGTVANWLRKKLGAGPCLWASIRIEAQGRGTREQSLLLASRSLRCKRISIGGKPIGGGRWKFVYLPVHEPPTLEEAKRIIAEYRQLNSKPQGVPADGATTSPIPPADIAPLNATPPQLVFRAANSEPHDSPMATLKVKPKRSTEKGEGRVKLIAALTAHHKYSNGGSLNLEPVGSNELARAASVSQSTASEFFNDAFKGHGQYKMACQDATKLAAMLKLLRGEFAPHHLYGSVPQGERDGDDM
jgi:hypothetical protein